MDNFTYYRGIWGSDEEAQPVRGMDAASIAVSEWGHRLMFDEYLTVYTPIPDVDLAIHVPTLDISVFGQYSAETYYSTWLRKAKESVKIVYQHAIANAGLEYYIYAHDGTHVLEDVFSHDDMIPSALLKMYIYGKPLHMLKCDGNAPPVETCISLAELEGNYVRSIVIGSKNAYTYVLASIVARQEVTGLMHCRNLYSRNVDIIRSRVRKAIDVSGHIYIYTDNSQIQRVHGTHLGLFRDWLISGTYIDKYVAGDPADEESLTYDD